MPLRRPARSRTSGAPAGGRAAARRRGRLDEPDDADGDVPGMDDPVIREHRRVVPRVGEERRVVQEHLERCLVPIGRHSRSSRSARMSGASHGSRTASGGGASMPERYRDWWASAPSPDRVAAAYGPLTKSGRVHGLEVGAGEPVQLVEDIVVEARVGHARHVPRRAVVGEDHPVALERDCDHLGLRRQAGKIGRRLEADPQPHRRQAGAGRARRVVAGGVEVRLAGDRCGEPERMEDPAGGQLVVAHEPREDRQTCRVGGRPVERAERVRVEIPLRARACLPGAVDQLRVVQLVEPAGVFVEQQHVAIRAALDERVVRDGIGARIGLVVIVERHRAQRRAAVDDLVRDAVALVRPEVHVERLVAADRADQRRAVGANGQRVDPPIPDVGGREHGAAPRRPG